MRALLQGEIDWTHLIRMARPHGLIPLLYWNLNSTCPDAVPKAILDQLQRHFHVNNFHNRFLTQELLKILDVFKVHEVLAVPYKGPVLAARAYGNVSLRQFGDLDILIPPRNISRAKDLLISHGYRLRRQFLSAQEEAAYLRGDYEYRFVRDEDRVVVGLHWRVTPSDLPFPFAAMRVWDRLEQVSLAGTTVPSLAPEDLLLLLCVHGTKDLWERLGWVCDVATLIGVHQGMDWDRVVKQAVMLGGARMLFVGLGLAYTLLDTALPQGIVRRIEADPVVKTLLAEVSSRLFAETDGLAGEDERFVLYLKVRERFWDRMRVYYSSLYRYQWITPYALDRAFLQLPSSLSILSYSLLPLRFVGKYGLNPLRHLVKNFLGF